MAHTSNVSQCCHTLLHSLSTFTLKGAGSAEARCKRVAIAYVAVSTWPSTAPCLRRIARRSLFDYMDQPDISSINCL